MTITMLILALFSLVINGFTEGFKGSRLSFLFLFILFQIIFHVLTVGVLHISILTFSLFAGVSIAGFFRLFVGIQSMYNENLQFLFTRIDVIPWKDFVDSNPIIYGMLLNFCYVSFLFLFSKKNITARLLIIIIALLILFHLTYFSLSGGIVFLLINVGFFMAKYNPKLLKRNIAVLIPCMTACFLIVLSNSGGEFFSNIDGESSRIRNYKTSLNVIKNRPVLGYGVGNELTTLQQNRSSNSWEFKNKYHAHNQYFEMLIGGGFIYLIIFLTLLGVSLYHGILNHNFILIFFLLIIFSIMFIESLLVTHKGFIFVAFIWSYLLYHENNQSYLKAD
ncbi:O-antigen ligase family protein [Aquimarina sp. W85]|uniref:O-antigen ligase family protein n=1 Tax=Aquimarina rhodophyticola TaxID=3342246 RepID=UPI0036728C1C